MNMMNKCAKFHKDSPSDEKLNSISRTRLNFRRRPILCTTLYRNFMQASNFGGTFDQLFLRIFYEIFTEDASLLFLYDGAKKSKMTKNSNQGGTMVQKKSKWPKTQLKGVLPKVCNESPDRKGFCRMKEEGLIYKVLPQIFYFLPLD